MSSACGACRHTLSETVKSYRSTGTLYRLVKGDDGKLRRPVKMGGDDRLPNTYICIECWQAFPTDHVIQDEVAYLKEEGVKEYYYGYTRVPSLVFLRVEAVEEFLPKAVEIIQRM